MKFVIPIIIFIVLSYTGYKDYFQNGLWEQNEHQAMTELGLLNLKNTGVVWYGCYPYFNDNCVTDLMFKTRDCKGIKSKGKFYPGHNKYDIDTTLDMMIGVWKPKEFDLSGYKIGVYKGIKIYKRLDK
jgi:hypothetical protein